MSYLLKAVEHSTKDQIERERKDFLSRPLEEQGSIGVRLIETDLQKTKALDLAGKIMRNQQIQIQIHQLKLGRPLASKEIDDFLKTHEHEPQVIYDRTTEAIMQQAELLLESEKRQMKKINKYLNKL